MAELGQQTVQLSELVKRAAEDSFVALEELIQNLASQPQSDANKKIGLLKYINKTRQRLLRLHVLTKWCTQIPLVRYCQQLEGSLSSHDMCFTQAADTLFFTHEGLQQARQPVYDVPSALEILLTGTYCRLPKCVEDMGMQTALAGEERELALPKLDTLLRSRLLEASLPDEISSVMVSDGRVVLCVDGEFKVQLTLGYRGNLSLWRILHLELLVGERSGPLKIAEIQRFNIGDDLERRMAAAENPFATMYSILHEFCIALVMDTVLRQVNTLRQGRWKDAIRFELISDNNSGQEGNTGSTQVPPPDGDIDANGLKTPGLKVMYWLDLVKGVGGADSGNIPFLKIEPGKDQRINCSHNTYVIDPLTGNEAEFVLDQSCIDVEYLLLRAISCNIHTRLSEVQRVLKTNNRLCQVEDDIILKHAGDNSHAPLSKILEFMQKNPSTDTGQLGEELLCVRAYGLSYVALGINIRNGRFLLRSSRNLMLSSAVTECEDALNQGSLTPAEVFISLRNKSILYLFASVGRFLGLKVYEKGVATVKLPKSIIKGSDLLLMGFPNCGNSYYLLIQLDMDFKALFTLLESKQDSTSRSGLLSGPIQIFRFNKIDIGRMQMVEHEVNLSLLDNERLCLEKEITGISDLISESVSNPDAFTDSAFQGQGCLQSGFSSLADDVFEFDKGMPLSRYLPKQNYLAEPSPSNHLGAVQGIQQGGKFGLSTTWDRNSQYSLINNTGKVSAGSSPFNTRLMSESNHKNVRQTGSSPLAGGHNYGVNTSTPSPVRIQSFNKLSSATKNYSDQDLTSSKSPLQLGDTSGYLSMDEDHLRKVMDSPKEGLPSLSTNWQTSLSYTARMSPALRNSIQHSRSSLVKTPSGGQTSTVFKSSATGLHMIPPACQTLDSLTSHGNTSDTIPKISSRKRCLSDIVHSIPSLQRISAYGESQKKRKTSESGDTQHAAVQLNTSGTMGKFVGRTCGSILREANHGKAPSSIYVSALLQVIRHCSLCIKHARLTGQMEVLNIPYVEDVGLRKPSADLWFRLPSSKEDAWQHICLCLGRPGSTYWDVKVNDEHFRDLWELQKGKTGTPWGSGVRIANTSDVDSHIRYGPEGVVLSYRVVEDNSIKKLVADLQRLSNARSFAMGMRKLLEVKPEERIDTGKELSNMKYNLVKKAYGDLGDRMWDYMRRTFKIEAVGLMSLWFSYVGPMPGIIARFVVEWESGKEGCTMHVSPDQLWPHTKFLEDFINGGEVASLLDCIRLTAGPLHALAGAIRPARMVGTAATAISLVPSGFSTAAKTNGLMMSQSLAQNTTSSIVHQSTGVISGGGTNDGAASGNFNAQNGPIVSGAGRGGPGIVPSSLLPTDVSVVLRSPYWIRIIYRKNFAVDMRCFAGDQVWLQPATPPKGGPTAGGSMPCPQFRPFIMEHVALGLNTLDNSLTPQPLGAGNPNNLSTSNAQSPAAGGNKMGINSPGVSRSTTIPGNPGTILNRVNNVLGAQNLAVLNSGISLAGRPMASATGVPVHVRGELNTAFIGLGDDGGYGGGWVPLAALKKVLRGILKYLGVLWLFSQLPDLLKSILRSILKENEGSLLNLDHEQPALRFFVGGYVFAVSVHRVQLLLQVLSVKRFHQQQQQQQQQQNQTNGQDELSSAEIHEICDYFSGRVASEPYDASRVASFITLLTLPIWVLREFLKLIAWKKGTSQGQGGDIAPSQRTRVELCLECHVGSNADTSVTVDNVGQVPLEGAISTVAKSNIHYDRPHNAVDFGLTVVLDPANIPQVNAAGGAAWLPHCVSVRLKYAFGENPHMALLGMEGSHGGRALWPHMEDWERCKQRVARAVEIVGNGSGSGPGASSVDVSQGRLRVVAETIQHSLYTSLVQLRKGGTGNASVAGAFTG
ncbi:mediator of RNA polymerase II transcription subunit 14 [Cryptomeria japonica]|uniref:mediator of RNA polymerase II transcription subunit 14 n=1 Tax=Cryptomeria japonica TaxID=3369 RepID=UPI0027D9EE8C|nr:mediator of RNA polymerase II transcription subunit 14 [Cryptomeria japonica]